MSDNVIHLPTPEQPLKPWEWLRELADALEKEGQEEEFLMVLAMVNQEGDMTRHRAQRYACSKIEAVGMLTFAAHDFCATSE